MPYCTFLAVHLSIPSGLLTQEKKVSKSLYLVEMFLVALVAVSVDLWSKGYGH